jgi:hypothetical protein
MEKTEWAIKNGPSRVHTGKIEHGKYRKKTRKTQKSTAQKKKDMQHGPQEQQWVNLGARER